MVKSELGTKRLCNSCGAKFYDFARSPIVCPACGAAFDAEAATKPKRSRSPAKAAPATQAPRGNKQEEELDELESEEADDSPIEDADELGEDSDMGEVIGGDDEEES